VAVIFGRYFSAKLLQKIITNQLLKKLQLFYYSNQKRTIYSQKKIIFVLLFSLFVEFSVSIQINIIFIFFFGILLCGRFLESFNNQIPLFMNAFGASNKTRLLRTTFNSDRIPDGTQHK